MLPGRPRKASSDYKRKNGKRPPPEPEGAETSEATPTPAPFDGLAIRLRLPRGPAGEVELSDVLVGELATLVGPEFGNTPANAARVCGVRPDDLARWLTQGEADYTARRDTVASRLVQAVSTSASDFIASLSRSAVRGATRDPRHALELLARRAPEDWAPAAPAPADWRKAYNGMTEAELVQEAGKLLGKAEDRAARRNPKQLQPAHPEAATEAPPAASPEGGGVETQGAVVVGPLPFK